MIVIFKNIQNVVFSKTFQVMTIFISYNASYLTKPNSHNLIDVLPEDIFSSTVKQINIF